MAPAKQQAPAQEQDMSGDARMRQQTATGTFLGKEFAMRWPKPLPDIGLEVAEGLAKESDARRRSSGMVLAGAAKALSRAEQHYSAAILLQDVESPTARIPESSPWQQSRRGWNLSSKAPT
eukprot:1676257-Amphidinium_carterae.1